VIGGIGSCSISDTGRSGPIRVGCRCRRVLDHWRRLRASTLGHWFADFRDQAGVPDASLHRLRHSVAKFLVARGEILQAQERLGHADAATTLHGYANALPLTDQNVATPSRATLDPLCTKDPRPTPSAGVRPWQALVRPTTSYGAWLAMFL
jgi:hypothetical protein